jgi:hypothetical protein
VCLLNSRKTQIKMKPK